MPLYQVTFTHKQIFTGAKCAAIECHIKYVAFTASDLEQAKAKAVDVATAFCRIGELVEVTKVDATWLPF